MNQVLCPLHSGFTVIPLMELPLYCHSINFGGFFFDLTCLALPGTLENVPTIPWNVTSSILLPFCGFQAYFRNILMSVTFTSNSGEETGPERSHQWHGSTKVDTWNIWENISATLRSGEIFTLLQVCTEITCWNTDSDARIPEIPHCQQAGGGADAASPIFSGQASEDSRGRVGHDLAIKKQF